MDSVQLLRAVGNSLYGRQWQSALAGVLGINDRTMRRWVSGEWNIPFEAWTKMASIMIEREMELGHLRQELGEFMAGDIRSQARRAAPAGASNGRNTS